MSNRSRCGALLPVAAAVVAAAIVFAPQPALAQTPFVPYFGKNQIRYTNFRWYIYTTDHFEIYYYPEDRAAPRTGRRVTPRARISTSAQS